MYIRLKQNDGGKSLSKRPKEQNDCSVISASIAFNLDYDFVHDIYQACGRKYAGGAFMDVTIKALKILAALAGRKCNRLLITSMHVFSFQTMFGKGTYIVFLKENWQDSWHLCTYINGTINDKAEKSDFKNKIVIAAWQIV